MTASVSGEGVLEGVTKKYGQKTVSFFIGYNAKGTFVGTLSVLHVSCGVKVV